MRELNNQSGFTMIEALVTAAILGIVSYAAMTLSSYVGQNVTKAELASKEPRLINSMISTAMTKITSFPTKIATANNNSLDPAQFNNTQMVEFICFTPNGASIDCADPLVGFKLEFYRILLKDPAFDATADIANLPMERVFFRMTDIKKKKTKFFSRIHTKVILN